MSTDRVALPPERSGGRATPVASVRSPRSARWIWSSGHLPGVTVAYETWGTLAADGGNAVLLEHADRGRTRRRAL